MPGPLKILLADCGADRPTALEGDLREIRHAVVICTELAGDLFETVRSVAPDVIVVAMVRPDQVALDAVKRANADNPCAVVLFVGHDDAAFMEEAIAAGVSSYNVANAVFPDVEPIVMAAVAIFRRYQRVSDELRNARAVLREREAVTDAKTLLMRCSDMDEPQAYRWLRRRAMNQNKRIPVIAAELLATQQAKGASE